MYKQLRYVMGLIFISKYVSNIPHPDFVELLLFVQDKNNILDPQSNFVYCVCLQTTDSFFKSGLWSLHSLYWYLSS